MIDRVPVFTALHAYRVAVAALPSRVYLAATAMGAIVVVDGAGEWCDAVRGAVEAGASAIVVAEPHAAPHGAIADVVEQCPVPVVVHRSRLRHDIASDAVEQRAGVRPRTVVAECRSPEGEMPLMVRDAVGWMRKLGDTPLSVAASSISRAGGLALLRPAAGGLAGGSVIITVTRPEGTLLRVTALGETTTELEFDEPMGNTELATSTGGGRLVSPTRFEAGERLALRRALEALAGQDVPNDVADLNHDDNAAREILHNVNSTTSVVF